MGDERRGKIDHDNPPFSRLFVVCSKNHDETDIKEAFGKYGTLQDVWVVKDRNTHENKGIAYIKFEKASEAHIAMEHLHCSKIGSDPKQLKVLLADSKGQTRAGTGDTKPRTRIFILTSKSVKSSDLEEEFSKYGEIESVQVLTDRNTGEPKGCAYVKYEKPSSAFIALESCDVKYKAVIAEPRVPRGMVNSSEERGSNDRYSNSRHQSENRRISYPSATHENQPANIETISYTDLTDPGTMQRLYIVCHTSLFEEQLISLFDLVPGLDNFELKTYRGSSESRGFAYATYRSLELACYAKRKLDGLEYPPGHKLIVKYAEQRPSSAREGEVVMMDHSNSGGGGGMASWNSSKPVTFTAASAATQAVAQAPDCVYTDVSLPNPQPVAAPNTPCRGKLFIVATPRAPEEQALQDVFCRFASLIDIKLIPGTSYGYIRYGMKESAEAAMMVMNNAQISGSTIRLSHQDETAGENKRSRSSFESPTAGW